MKTMHPFSFRTTLCCQSDKFPPQNCTVEVWGGKWSEYFMYVQYDAYYMLLYLIYGSVKYTTGKKNKTRKKKQKTSFHLNCCS